MFEMECSRLGGKTWGFAQFVANPGDENEDEIEAGARWQSDQAVEFV